MENVKSSTARTIATVEYSSTIINRSHFAGKREETCVPENSKNGIVSFSSLTLNQSTILIIIL